MNDFREPRGAVVAAVLVGADGRELRRIRCRPRIVLPEAMGDLSGAARILLVDAENRQVVNVDANAVQVVTAASVAEGH